jgi:RimJ/RimL family protein N-acetyltransferase
MNILGKHVKLRAIELEDLRLLHEWSNDPEINYVLGGWHFPSSMQDQTKWFNNQSFSSSSQRFAIEIQDLGLVGMANITDINWKDRNAIHGMLLGNKDTRGKGYGVDTIMTIMRYSFEELGLERLDTTIIEYNSPSINVYTKKCGWTIEGIKKNYCFRKNRFWNMLVLGIHKDDYFQLIEKTKYWQNDN